MLHLRSTLLFLFSLTLLTTIKADNDLPAVLVIDFDQCVSDSEDGSNADYSEFTALGSNNGRVRLSADQGGYRNRPDLNMHSCTEGLNGTPAMCISFSPFCTYSPSTSAAFRFDVKVTPVSQDPLQLEGLEFYQKAPELFSWINGRTGINNYPTRYGLRVFKNGQLLRDISDISTSRDWRQEIFDFRGDPDFAVTTETVFNFELMAYCSAGIIGGFGQFWDLEDIKVTANCIGECAPLDIAGDVTVQGGGTEYFGCIRTTQFQLVNNSTFPNEDYHYLIVNENQQIIDIFSNGDLIDLTQTAAGTYKAYGYVDLGEGLPMIGSQFDNLEDIFCLSISESSVTIFINEPDGGTLMGGPFEFCNDGLSMDFTPPNAITLTDERGDNTQWIITDAEGKEILGLPFNIYEFDFESLPPGFCLIWNISYDGWIKNLEVGRQVSDLRGFSNPVGNVEIPACFDFSNSVTVFKNSLTPGVLSGGPFTFCTGDGEADRLQEADIMLSQGSGTYNSWVLTDVDGVNIIAVTDDLNTLDFDTQGRGNCTLWSLTHDVVMPDLIPGGDFTNLIACSERSNFITIIKLDNEGGTISGGPFEFCVGDGLDDFIPAGAITLENNRGANSNWLLTDLAGSILSPLANSYSEINIETQSLGTCQLRHLSYDGPIDGIEIGDNISNLDGCYALSNAINLTKIDCTPLAAGTITGGPYRFCTADGTPDRLTGLSITGNTGNINSWLVTDTGGSIISSFANSQNFDVETLAAGSYLLYHITYDQGLTGLNLGDNLSNLMGKFALSQPVSLSRTNPQGGELSVNNSLVFCVGDGTEDRIFPDDISLTGNSGNSTWVLTDAQGQIIIGVNENLNEFDFESSGVGLCQLYNLSSINALSGLEVNATLNAIQGCFDLSNSITITRNAINGGNLDNGVGSIQFCVGDGEPDFIPNGSISLTGNIGNHHQWVITNSNSTEILLLPDSPYEVDFDAFDVGSCVLWNVSSVDPSVLELGDDLTEIEGCAARSNSFITIFRSQNTGGTLSGGQFNICVQDGTPDFILDGAITVTGNTGANNQWIVVDSNGIITEAPLGSYSIIDFDMSPQGVHTLFHLSYDGPISGLGDNLPLSGLEGCFSISDGISINCVICPALTDNIELYQVSSTHTITLTNRGTEDLVLTDFWLSHNGESVKIEDTQELCGQDLISKPGEYTILTLPFDIDKSVGSLALHLESIHGEKLIRDFVQWGATGQVYEEEAIAAGLWAADTFAASITDGMAITVDDLQSETEHWMMAEPMACAVTATSDDKAEILYIYPNPVSDKIVISNLNENSDYQYEIRNLMGQLIAEGQQSGQAIEINNLQAGSYLLRLRSETTEQNLRFQKL